MRCPGLFHGEAIVHVDESHKSILIALMASKPNMFLFLSCFQRLCQLKFVQWILNFCLFIVIILTIDKLDTESVEVQCCSDCIKSCYFEGNFTSIDDIGIFDNKLTELVCKMETYIYTLMSIVMLSVALQCNIPIWQR